MSALSDSILNFQQKLARLEKSGFVPPPSGAMSPPPPPAMPTDPNAGMPPPPPGAPVDPATGMPMDPSMMAPPQGGPPPMPPGMPPGMPQGAPMDPAMMAAPPPPPGSEPIIQMTMPDMVAAFQEIAGSKSEGKGGGTKELEGRVAGLEQQLGELVNMLTQITSGGAPGVVPAGAPPMPQAMPPPMPKQASLFAMIKNRK